MQQKNKFIDDDEGAEELILKFILLGKNIIFNYSGNRGVGKSNILLRYTKKDFKFNMPPTMGIEFASTRIYLKNKK